MIKILLAFFICTTIYGLIVAYPIYRAMKLATQLVSETKPYEQHPENPTQNFLVAGDSTAAGVGSVDNKLSTAGRLGAQFPDAEITNLGVSGDRLQDLLKTLKNLSNQRFDLILLQIGANDITHFTPYKKIDGELSEILSLTTAMSKKTILLTCGDVGLANVFRWPLSKIMSARTRHVRKVFMEVASRYATVSYVDLYRDKKHDPFDGDEKKYYAPDSFHLSGDGYGFWYSQIQTKL